MSNNKLFGEEKVGKLLLRFSIPIILSYLISELYNMVDTIFIGREVGASGIAALVLVFPIQRIIVALGTMIAVGTSTAFSRSNGRNDIEGAKKVLRNGFSLSYSIMIALTLIVLIFGNNILMMLGASKTILPLAKEYLFVIIFGSMFVSMTIFISNIMIAVGKGKLSILSTSIGAVLNIIVDYILVTKLGMGVMGAAIATTLSQIAGFIFAYYHYRKIQKHYNIKLGFEIDKKVATSIILVGISAFVIEAEDGILMAVLNNLLASTVGDSGIVVLGVISKVYMFLFISMLGIAAAMQPIAAYNMGAKNYRRLKGVMHETTKFAFMAAILIWVPMMIFAPQLISIFVTDAAVIQESVKAFRIMIAVFPVISMYYVSIYYFQALGKAKTSIMVSILRQIIIMIPISIIMVKGFNLGAMGVWLSYPISDILASLASFMLIRNEGIELNIAVKKQQLEKEKISGHLA
ncbi:MATE family efflux transporter [Tissierella sp. Yu-01]|uniref:MATE family efflux transporter n=1 Tax=Tissierella sp. Yu-01 TaxID=3035694 RepID=UPI00240E8243|nr:MATE family efflux transporter [Tissierella sp. Yu-01]WFA08106.1 MATE family efflux transporter [Tissierella sp. Yu-01]